jgi:hypothetical protein
MIIILLYYIIVFRINLCYWKCAVTWTYQLDHELGQLNLQHFCFSRFGRSKHFFFHLFLIGVREHKY